MTRQATFMGGFKKARSILVVALLSFSFCSLPAWGQEADDGQAGTVTGTVTDSTTGAALPGVNVTIVGTQQGAAAGANGQYSITGVEPGTYTLQASFVGYETKRLEGVQVAAGETTTADVAMSPGRVSLENVVVTALGVERQERSLTYSAEQVDVAEIAESGELNMISSLQGKVAGLNISSGGFGVGSSMKVVLRGNRSFNTSDEPLYVVDGVPVRGDISNMSPEIIQSINVLKGPNAAALYGSEAQNGAIVVTTKRGQEGQVDVTWTNNVMVRSPNILHEFQNVYGQGTNGEYNRRTFSSWGPRMEGQMVQHWSPNPELADTQIPYSPQPNNIRDFFQLGYQGSSNLTASVGSENVQGLFSYTYSGGQGIVPNNTLQRHNLNVRLTSQLGENLSLDGKLSYVNQEIDYPINHGNHGQTYYAYRIPRSISTGQASNYEYQGSEGQLLHSTWLPGFGRSYNPYWAANNIRETTPSEGVTGLASLTYDFTDAISLMVRGSYDRNSSESVDRIHNDTGTTYNFGYFGVEESASSEFNGDVLLSYSENVSDNWFIDANVGGNIKKERNRSLNSNTGDALIVPNFFTISNTLNPITNYNPGAPIDIYSVYGSAQIGWRDAIFLDVTGRNDWSSTLPAESRSYFYPSVGLSAIVSDLIPSFPKAFDFARVRASWAQVGNSAPAFRTQRFANFIPGGRDGFLALNNELPASNLKPEQTVSYEAGVDLRFFGERLGLDFTVYQTNTRNQLFAIDLPPASGASSLFTNGGNVQNRGIETLLRTTPLQMPDFRWDLDLNFSANRNEVVEISDEREILFLGGNFAVEEGEPFGQIYTRGFQRDEQGRVLINSNGLPQVTPGATVAVANPNPDWTVGLSSSLSFGNFSAGFVIDHTQGGSLLSETATLTLGEGHSAQTLEGRDGGLIFGENLFADETAVMASDGSPNTTEIDAETFWSSMGGHLDPIGEAFVEDATNMRLQEVSLGYSLPQSMISYLPVANVQLTLVGRNLFFFYRAAESVDPNILSGTGKAAPGVSNFAPPTARSYGINLRLDF